jgi:hypothetical protein
MIHDAMCHVLTTLTCIPYRIPVVPLHTVQTIYLGPGMYIATLTEGDQ